MTCPRCNTEIAEGALVCPVCGDWCAASAQKARVDALKANTKNIVHESFKSNIFLAMTILMTVAAAAKTLTCFTLTAGAGGFNFNFDFTVIFFIIAAVFCWQARSSTNPILAGDHLGRVAFFDTVEWILLLIASCLLGLGALLCFAVIGIANEIMAEAWGDIEPILNQVVSGEELEMVTDIFLNQAGLLFGVMAVAFLLVAAFCIWGCIIHRRRKIYLKSFEDSINEYNISKPAPYTGAIVYASFNLLSVFTSFDSTVFMGGLFASLIGTLALNGYIIASAVWMAKLHRDELANNAEIENESAVLNNLIYASKIEFEKKSNKAEENQ
jgi:hypothetical protein